MLRKIVRWVIILVAGTALVSVVLFGANVLFAGDTIAYKTTIQIIAVPSQNRQFVLLTDLAGFDDRSWYVYESTLDASLTEAQQREHSDEGALFWNYSEAGEHKDNPRLRIEGGRFLVFSRGGLDHSLYDLRARQVLINEVSPLAAAVGKPDLNLNLETQISIVEKWVKENLHERIQSHIKNPT
jgi:hypothetical protein